MNDISTVLAAVLREEVQRGLDDLRNQIARDQSPWMSATSAARYADCSPSAIFKAANMGLIARYDSFPGPRFRKEDIDTAIKNGGLARSNTGKLQLNRL